MKFAMVLCVIVVLANSTQYTSAHSIIPDTSTDPVEFEPSTFRTDEFSLAHQISFPANFKERDDFSVSIACTAHVTRKGKMKHPFCLGGDKESKDFERRILLATRRAKMNPARVKGIRTPVVVKFTTIFRRTNGEAYVSVVPNHFLNTEKFGVNYSAPQLLTRRSKGYVGTCRRMNLIVRITVDSAGAASNARFFSGDQETVHCIEPVKNRIGEKRYVPGMVNGVATTMDHLFLVNWRGGWTIAGETVSTRR